MNLLDENFPDDQRRLLESKGIRVQKIGRGIGRRGIDDTDIIPLLHQMRKTTFFSLDEDFYHRRWCHRAYCLVYLDIAETKAAKYVRRVLRHRDLKTKAKRMGMVIKVRPEGLTLWRISERTEIHLEW